MESKPFPLLKIPRPTAVPRIRSPKANIPQTRAERNELAQFVRGFVKEWAPATPISADELRQLAEKVIELTKVSPSYREYIGILINNELWRETLATIPYERRLLLLPKCLRVEAKCPATFDEFGLLCKQCGLCSIQDLQNEAERLGYAVLVAEGSALVMQLIQTDKIDAIVGVSCISVLERAFPYMEAAAIPGIAIPLLQDDCIDTTVDLDWVWDIIHLTSEDKTRRLALNALRQQIDSWFTSDALESIMGAPEGDVERIGRAWLSRAGKRWRPFLAIAAYQALRENPEAPIPEDLRKIAVSVECFHKASLIHDDIEDNDATRYGEKTLHEEFGIPVALNVGDFLIGEGYRMIHECRIAPELKAEMLRVAVDGHRKLCRGQGEELAWTRTPMPLTQAQVLHIFLHKTAPAFEVALRLGAIYAGQHDSVSDVLGAYSEALGIAYQIRDDLNDFSETAEANDLHALRPSLLLAIAHERARGEQKEITGKLWNRSQAEGWTVEKLRALFRELKADERAAVLLETYKEEAIHALRELANPSLKGLLRRVIGKIFNDVEIKGWCNEFETRNAAGGANGPAVAG